MTALTDALKAQVHIKAVEGDLEALRPIVAAARRVAEADEIWWCETHNHEGDRQDPAEIPDAGECWQQVWGEYDHDNWCCQMVRRPLLKPVVKS